MRKYLLNILIALDQLGTVLIGGFPDETLSSYAYRMNLQGKPFGFMRYVIDAIFWYQPDHCQQAYRSEQKRMQEPPEFRI